MIHFGINRAQFFRNSLGENTTAVTLYQWVFRRGVKPVETRP